MTGTSVRYDPIAVALHWAIAFLIIGLIALGVVMDDLPARLSPAAYTLHKSCGILVLGLSLLRLVWRLINPPLALPAGMSRSEHWLAKGTHWLFYGLMVGIPFTGWLMVSASQKYPTVFFWLGEVPFLPLPEASLGKTAAHQFHTYHAWLAYGTAALIVLHIAAALKHHYVNRDTVLTRMLPRWLQRRSHA